MKRGIVGTAAALSLVACGGSSDSANGAVPRSALAVHSIEWNPTKVALGHIQAVTDTAGATVIFSDMGMSVFIAGALSASDPTITSWQSAGVIPAADTDGSWMVGIDGTGRVLQVQDLASLEDVSDRYGLSGVAVHSIAAIGPLSVGFGLDAGIAVADGSEVTRYDAALPSLVGAADRVAGISAGSVVLFDVAHTTERSFSISGAAFTAFSTDGKLVAATSSALYAENASGDLTQVEDLSNTPIHGLAASPMGVWVAMGTELGLFTSAAFAVSSGAGLAADARLVGSTSGDVFALSAGTMARFSAASPGDETLWEQTVEPIFTEVCASCHLPGGTANIDLSFYGAWAAMRTQIEARVIEKTPTAMPPTSSGLTLTDADTAAIKAWLANTSM